MMRFLDDLQSGLRLLLVVTVTDVLRRTPVVEAGSPMSVQTLADAVDSSCSRLVH
jgi:hypothetical protein